MQPPEPAAPRWESSLDGVRGLAATGIIVFHCWAYLAVDLQPRGVAARLLFLTPQGLTAFFALSGFLLFRPYVEAALGHRPRPRTRTLWRRRFYRVYPAHAVVFLLACVVLPLGFLEVGTEHGRPGPFGVLANLLMVQGYFPSQVLSGLGASWSLVPELMFYALLPAFGWLAVRLLGRLGVVGLVLPLLPMLVLGWVVRDHAYTEGQRGGGDLGEWAPVFYYSFLSVMDLIAAGMLAAVVIVVATAAWRTRIAAALLLLGAVAVVVMPMGIPGNTLVALACGGLYVLLCSPGESGRAVDGLRSALGWGPLRLLGRLSYASYLWHLPVIHVVATRVSDDAESLPAAVLLGGLVLAVTTLLAWLTTVAVVEPAIRHAHRSRPKRGQERAPASTLSP